MAEKQQQQQRGGEEDLQTRPEKKGIKRKLEEQEEEESNKSPKSPDSRQSLRSKVSQQVEILKSTFSWNEIDRAAAKRAINVLVELAKNEEDVNVIVEGGAVPALVKHLQSPPSEGNHGDERPLEHEVEKGSAFALGLLAVQVELPGCKGIWTVYHKSARGHNADSSKTASEEDEYHAYLIISLESRTMLMVLLLCIGNSN